MRGTPATGWKHSLAHFFGLISLMLLLSAAFAIGYPASILLFRFTGTPVEPFAHIVSALLGIVALGMFTRLFWLIWGGWHGKKFPGDPFMADILAALNRIASGDFNVLLPVDAHSPFEEMAESVNKMARELGSMEKLRQDFISDVSHEIQSPLTSISGFAALLRQEGVSPQEIDHYAAIIETESRRLSKLSANLLKLSALEADGLLLERSAFRLDKQIEAALLMLEPQWAGKHIFLELSLDKIDYSGNEDLLSQVWINLLHNAIKFTGEEGIIRVALTAENGAACCVIADNGIGIPEEAQIHIFERFYKVDKSRDRALGGNGLGLSLVKKIVGLHGGAITVASALGSGAAFTVRLPL
jgi:signal transduction histidine kinase